MTRLRISAHSLAIENGLYTTPPTTVENRTCKNCTGDIGNEYYFFIECYKYSIDQTDLYIGFKEKCTHFTSLDDKDKFIYMLTADIDVAELVAKLAYDNLP